MGNNYKTCVNEEYQKLIDTIETAKQYISCEKLLSNLDNCIYALRKLGIQPALNDDAIEFQNITNDMLKTYIQKNHDYGNSFEQSLDKFGLIAGVIRIGDKMNRIESLSTKEAKVKNESIKDSFLDMANYCIMSVMWLNKQK